MSPYLLRIEPDALDDIQNAVHYYNQQSFGLGLRFYYEVDIQLQLIRANPQFRSIRYRNVRLAQLKRFKYAFISKLNHSL